MKKILTLCIPIKGNKVLLGMKKRGFGCGRWNGFGGKVEEGETIEQATIRELEEESGIRDGNLIKSGILEFSFENDKKILQVHIFRLLDFSEEPVETEEMRAQWFSFDEIPFSQMWTDDKYWFPLLLAEKLFEGKFLFDRPSDAEYSAKIISKELIEVPVLR
jgi:8-oxo-dGTP diphosphatase/2-hydroxy-dATP diphosphatase